MVLTGTPMLALAWLAASTTAAESVAALKIWLHRLLDAGYQFTTP